MRAARDRVGRRRFLKGAAVGAAGLVAQPPSLVSATQAPGVVDPGRAAPSEEEYRTDRTGADFMVDVLKALDLEYVAANPGSSFRGLHEAIINYGGNTKPELLTCCHEESSVAMAHGYAKIEGKPMMVMAHGTVGLQHASMAVYNAYADRVPVYMVIGNILDATWRRSDVEWTHAVQDASAMVRDYTKWDDTPVSLTHFAESAMRAYKMATTPPYGPVVLVADAALQEEPIAIADRGKLRVPRLAPSTPPAADAGAVAELAKMLVAAENPAHHRGAAGPHAEGHGTARRAGRAAAGAGAGPRGYAMRMNFPSRHPLKMGAGVSVGDANLVLGLEHPELLHEPERDDAGEPAGDGGAPALPAGHQDRDHQSRTELIDQEQLPGHRPLCRGRPGPRRRHRGHAAGAHRGLPAADHARPEARDRAARRPDRRRHAGGVRAGARAGGVGLGRQPHLHRAPVRRDLEPDQG